MNKPIVVRFPPSPTGEVHIGNVRTLLFNYLFAKKNGGKIVFRFEDTDKERSKKEYEEPMLKALATLGLTFDEGPFRQSERTEIYKKYLHELVEKGLAYEGEESSTGTGKVVRLKNVERDIVWNDLVKGEIKINTHTFKDENGNSDIIIARNIDDPLYHFTVVVDDFLMGITHVLRGDDHVTSTPRQIMILEALGAPVPEYAHFPTIIGEDKKKLSKRNGNTSLQKFFDLGYLPEAMTNYLAFLGWNPGGEREFFSLEELVKEFSLEKCQKSPAQFDIKKLNNINKHYLDKFSDEDFVNYIINSFPEDCREGINNNLEIAKKIYLKVYRERISTGSELVEMAKLGESDIFYSHTFIALRDIQKACFKNKDKEQTLDEVKSILKQVLKKLENISEQNWNFENLKTEIFDWSSEFGRGFVLHPLRMILSGKDKSPDPFTIMDIIGKDESLKRLNQFIV